MAESNLLKPLVHGVGLLDRHAILESVDGDVVLAVAGGIVDQRDHGRVEFMLDGKHAPKLARAAWAGQASCLTFRRNSPCGGGGAGRNGYHFADNTGAFRMTRLLLIAVLALAACEIETTTTAPASQPQAAGASRVSVGQAQANFTRVVNRVEPVAERTCRQQRPDLNCDFRIVVDGDRNAPPNAYQTLDKSGRPVIGFTMALIRDARNENELAFVLGHEAAHHIAGHIPETQQRALEGALVGTILGTLGGLEGSALDTAGRLGASVGARRFSKEFELEADRLGTVITARAGYDPVNGAAFFQRIPDPGDRFLGTHPPNSDRIRIVRQTAAGL